MRRLVLFVAVLLITSPALAASPKVLPPSYTEATLGGATRDYQAIAVWEDATDGILADGQVLTCYPDADFNSNQFVAFVGATTTANLRRVVRAAPGYEGQVIFRNTVDNGSCFYVAEQYLGLWDLVIWNDQSTAINKVGIYFSGADFSYTKIIGCRVKCTNSGAGNAAAIQFNYATGNANPVYIVNSSTESDEYGIYVGANCKLSIYNSVLYGGTDNLTIAANPPVVVKNVIFQGYSSHSYVGGISATTCMLTGGADFYDAANGDFRLVPESNGIDDGTSLAADAALPFNTDKYGTTRPVGAAWDIGLYEGTGYVPPAITGGAQIFFFQ